MNRTTKRAKIKALNKTVEHPKTKTSQCASEYAPTLKPTPGFSLVELLVVVAILAILAAIAIPLFLNQRSKAAQGAVQSDARNLATNLNTLFTNLPRSADPNVELNGSDAVDTTLSGSGTIEVDGETLNVNLSPDVTITKTGNVNPADGAGLKITHASVDNWACVIPLPSSVAYAQTMTFQQTCGTMVSEVGNLLPLNMATGTDALGNTSGFKLTDSTAVSSSSQFLSGQRSMLITATGSAVIAETQNRIPVVPGEYYTFKASVRLDVGPRRVMLVARCYDALVGGNQIHIVTGTPHGLNSSWEDLAINITCPAGTASAHLSVYRVDNYVVGYSFYTDNWSFYPGTNTQWTPTGVPIVDM